MADQTPIAIIGKYNLGRKIDLINVRDFAHED
jgi:hypothetical protein